MVETDRNRDEIDDRPVRSRAAQRNRYGGLHWGAAFFGWLVAVGISVLLIALISAAGGAIALTSAKPVVNSVTTNAAKVSASAVATVGIIGGALLLIALAIAYYCGGYVAGRMSRFDGARQGLGVWVIGIIITILLALIGGIFGSAYNVLQQLNLPRIPIHEGSLTAGGLITLLATIIVTVAAAMIGGKAGQHYHTKVDRAAAV